MGSLKSESVVCPIDQKCSQWAKKDLFNFFGCMLEPATLPTQYYMALMYMATTLTLTMQAVYYRHIYPRLKSNKRRQEASQETDEEQISEYNYGVNAEQVNNAEKCRIAPSSPIPLPNSSHSSSHEDERYLMSARSLSVSHTPTAGSIPAQITPTSDAEQQGLKEPLLGEVKPKPSTSSPKPKTLLCAVFLVTLFLGSCDWKLSGIHQNDMKLENPSGGMVFHIRTQILKAKEIRVSTQGTVAAESNGIGSFLGWGMAAIYLVGRLPQICLNIKKGSAKGLNPLMFVFALVGNATYVASILAKSLDWAEIRPNLPWLVDAGGCMLLDTFILIQFIYFRYRSTSKEEKSRD